MNDKAGSAKAGSPTNTPEHVTRLIGQAIARIIWIAESVELGDVGAALTSLRDLEADLASWLARDDAR
jgi:hypothetical protein